MAIEIIVPMIVSALIPYFAKGAEKIVDKSAEEIFAQRGKIWESVKGLFVADEMTTLNLFAENPEDAKMQGKLEGKLEERLKDNPETVKDLEALLGKLEKSISSRIISERIKDSDVSSKLKRSGDGGGDASIETRDVSGSKIINEIDIS
jgi:hypothetical protein